MAQNSGQSNFRRKEITYFEGVNTLVADNLIKVEEISHGENARSNNIGTIEKREGMTVTGTAAGGATFVATNNYGGFNFSNNSTAGLYRISKVGGVNSIYYLSGANVWTALAGAGTGFANPTELMDTCVAEGNLYLVDRDLENRYISKTDGVTVTLASSGITSNLYDSPNASIINYYKNKLYLADFVYGGVRYKNAVLRSSPPVGILSLVNEDTAVAAGATTIEVTDTKYIKPGEILDVRRGGSNITTLSVTNIGETTITVASVGAALLASDELWVNGTYSGDKIFRWVRNPSQIGVDVLTYDSFRLSSTTDNDMEQIKMMVNIGNMMAIASNNNLSFWNDYVLQNIDMGIGCVSKKGFIKCSGWLFFLHYSGIYRTNGGAPELISAKVEQYINNATKAGLEISCAGKKGRRIFFTIGNVNLKNPDNSTAKVLSDVCLEFNLTEENWYVHTGVDARELFTYLEATDPKKLMMISTRTNYPMMEFLASDITTDNGTEIPFRADTSNIMLASVFEKIVYPQEVAIEMSRGAGLKCYISLDRGDFYELEGEAAKGVTIFKATKKDQDTTQPPRCRNIRISLRHAGKQICKVNKVAINYTLSSEEEQIKDDDSQPKAI